jgi:hypothetical protein
MKLTPLYFVSRRNAIANLRGAAGNVQTGASGATKSLDKRPHLCYTYRNVHEEVSMMNVDIRLNRQPSKRPQIQPKEIPG